MVFDKNVRAIPEKADNPVTYFWANYLHKTSRLLKGESSTRHPI